MGVRSTMVSVLLLLSLVPHPSSSSSLPPDETDNTLHVLMEIGFDGILVFGNDPTLPLVVVSGDEKASAHSRNNSIDTKDNSIETNFVDGIEKEQWHFDSRESSRCCVGMVRYYSTFARWFEALALYVYDAIDNTSSLCWSSKATKWYECREKETTPAIGMN